MTSNTPMQDAFVASQQLREAVEDLSAQDLNRMSMADYREIRRRAGLPDIDPFTRAYAGYETQLQAPVVTEGEAAGYPPQPEPVQQPQGLDPDSEEFFHAWRQNRQSGGEGVGILSQPGRQAWIEAARRQPARSAMQGANVEAGPDMSRRQLPDTPNLDRRSARDRFSNQANLWQG